MSSGTRERCLFGGHAAVATKNVERFYRMELVAYAMEYYIMNGNNW